MNRSSLSIVQKEIRALRDPEKARFLSRFFKTGPGEYAEGDIFLGLTVPQTRAIARKHAGLSHTEIKKLLRSKFHEERLLALFLWVSRFKNAKPSEQKKIYDDYLASVRFINNWDLVDSSADKIVGSFLYQKSRAPLFLLAKSDVMWKRRIAVIATFDFIRKSDFKDSIKICELLLEDDHDLIHKATGWMLREIDKRDRKTCVAFLRKHCRRMPRTMLRYSIEKFPKPQRKAFLEGRV